MVDIEGQAGNDRREPWQGDIFWVTADGPQGFGIPHPHVVVGVEDARVVVCALTTNRKRLGLPGNVLLEAGEANLPRLSVVEAAKVSTVDKGRLGEFIGTLSRERVEQIMAGMRFVEQLQRAASDGYAG